MFCGGRESPVTIKKLLLIYTAATDIRTNKGDQSAAFFHVNDIQSFILTIP